MSRNLAAFVEQFVHPLLHGGEVAVGHPIRPKDRDQMLLDTAALMDPALRFARMRRAQRLTADPLLDDPDLDELSLWIGLHNTLVFDHPERTRVWARASTWRRVEGATRTFLSLAMPSTIADALARHLSVGAFLELRRTDTIVTTATGDMRFFGQPVPRRRLRLSAVPQTGHREETVTWVEDNHAPESERLLEDAMRASPLTCLLNPRAAPPGWSPLHAEAFVRNRAFARAICHAWASSPSWIEVGGAVAGAMMASLPAPVSEENPRPDPGDGPLALPGAVVPTDPDAIGGLVGALVHLHFLKVVELDARLGVAATSRDAGVQTFLALPLLLPWLQSRLGSPLGARTHTADGRGLARHESQIARRWGEYLEHLEELVPRSTVENLLAGLVPRIVQTS
jgi:hypothetical protein